MQKVVTSKICLRRLVFVTTMLMFVCLTGGTCLAEPTTEPSYVSYVRPYLGDSTAFVVLKEKRLCDTAVYTIELSDPSGKEAYAAALAALLANKRVKLEIHNQEGCKSPGWGTRLQSVYILSD